MAGYYRALDTTSRKVNGQVGAGVSSGCRNHSTRYATVIADPGTHLDEQTLASGGSKNVRIKWKLSDADNGKWGQKSEAPL